MCMCCELPSLISTWYKMKHDKSSDCISHFPRRLINMQVASCIGRCPIRNRGSLPWLQLCPRGIYTLIWREIHIKTTPINLFDDCCVIIATIIIDNCTDVKANMVGPQSFINPLARRLIAHIHWLDPGSVGAHAGHGEPMVHKLT
jgi:hypothetical protein